MEEDHDFISKKIEDLQQLIESATMLTEKPAELNAKDQAFKSALYTRDVEVTKSRIEREKGPLLKDSCTWLLNHSQYVKWTRDDYLNTLWIRGDARQGKTMLALSLVDDLQRNIDARSFRAYFFFDMGDEWRSSPLCLLKSLLYQILDAYPSLIRIVSNRFKEDDRFSSIHTLWNILHYTLEISSVRKVYFVVDGIDECPPDDVAALISLFNSPFGQERDEYREEKSCKLKWLITSRLNPRLSRFFANCFEIDLNLHEKEISAAVGKFIEAKVLNLVKQWRYENEVASSIERTLQTKADRTFLWVELACLELQKKSIRSIAVWESLVNLPSGLLQLYRAMLKRMKDHGLQEIGTELICSLALAVRDPTPAELAIMAGLPKRINNPHNLAEEIHNLCSPLLTIRGGRVHFVHRSAKDIIFSPENADLFPTELGEVHRRIATRCFQYICKDGVQKQGPEIDLIDIDIASGEVTIEDSSPDLVQYPMLHWADHARSACSQIPEDFNLNSEFFGKRSSLRTSWLRYYAERTCPDSNFEGATTLCAISYLGIPWLVEKLLETGHHADIDTRDRLGRTPLHWAAHRGNVAIVQLLLNNGAKSGITDKGIGAKPLHLAAMKGRDAAVELLLQHQPEDLDIKTIKSDMAPLHLATREGHIGTVRLLLKRGANIHVAGADGLRAIHCAAMRRQEPDELSVLPRGLDIDVCCQRFNQKPLDMAIVKQDIMVIKLLLEHGARISVCGVRQQTVLHVAALDGNEMMVRFLLKHEIGIHEKSSDGDTALHTAAWAVSVNVVKLLLQNSADVNEKNNSGETPLHKAARKGSRELMRLLMEFGANPKEKNNDLKTAEDVFETSKEQI